jgi:hypothetical protein
VFQSSISPDFCDDVDGIDDCRPDVFKESVGVVVGDGTVDTYLTIC